MSNVHQLSINKNNFSIILLFVVYHKELIFNITIILINFILYQSLVNIEQLTYKYKKEKIINYLQQ